MLVHAVVSVIVPAVVWAAIGLVALLLWGFAVSGWRDARTPPMPHDPARFFRLMSDSWGEPPVNVARWMSTSGGSTVTSAKGVQVAEVLAVLSLSRFLCKSEVTITWFISDRKSAREDPNQRVQRHFPPVRPRARFTPSITGNITQPQIQQFHRRVIIRKMPTILRDLP